ncbi:MAG: aldolase/citrate lyase family protein [Gemmatimonadota bacterium]
MRLHWMLTAAAVTSLGVVTDAHAQKHSNPVVDLLAAKQPVFGLYAPANPRVRPAGAPGGTAGGAPGGAPAGAATGTVAGSTIVRPAAPPAAPKTQAQLAADALAYKFVDYIFDGTMEGNFDAAYPVFSEFVQGMGPGTMASGPQKRFSHPLFVKTPQIGTDVAKASERIHKQLNLGVAGVVLVDVESADEVKAGLAAMRFKSKGGNRPDDVGDAPKRWGMTAAEYKEKADVWPLNPKGELVNFTIVESKEGLAKIREIAAVPGVGVLLPGAGTLRGVFSTTDSAGRRVTDEKAWEAAIQSVLAACKEFNVACGYPANERDIETRMKQGFSVFVIGWGENGFKAIDIGKGVAGRK